MMGQRYHDLLIGQGSGLVGWSGDRGADVDLVYHSDAGSLIFLGRFLISGLISGAARG
jgi:hypothetical protein